MIRSQSVIHQEDMGIAKPPEAVVLYAGPSNANADQIGNKNPFLFPRELLIRTLHENVRLSTHCKVHVSTQAENDNQSNWWLVHTKSRQEKKLAEELRVQGIPHYLPTIMRRSLSRRRERCSWLPLFPGYLFLFGTTDQRLNALRTNRIVATHEISDTELLNQHLRDLADLIDKGVPLSIEERITAGQKVEVKTGLLKGIRGIVIKRGGKTRLIIEIADMLGGVSLEIHQHLVEPLY